MMPQWLLVKLIHHLAQNPNTTLSNNPIVIMTYHISVIFKLMSKV